METKKGTASPVPHTKKEIGPENFIFLALLIGFFTVFAIKMGLMNAVNTMLNTAYALLIDTVLYLTAMCVVMGAISALLSEFGVVSLFDRVLRPFMHPIYGLPGVASLGIVTTFLSDNPAVLTLADDRYFRSFFKKYQFPALTNLATSFGMGMIVCTYMLGLPGVGGNRFSLEVGIGLIGAIAGSIVSTRMMLLFTKKEYGPDENMENDPAWEKQHKEHTRPIREGSVMTRFLNALIEGGASGVKMGMEIAPGVLTICTVIMMLTYGPSEAGGYTGGAYEGIKLIPLLAEKLDFLLKPLFGFSSPEAIGVPITALGAAGAALSVTKRLLTGGLIGGNDIAVFTAMCMCWSGYLSTHVSMMDALSCRKLTGKAILSHTVGGLMAGIVAHWLLVFIRLF